MFGLVLLFSALFPLSFATFLMGKRDLVVYLTVFLMYCDNHCSVALPRGAVGWSSVSDCCIY